MMDKLITLCFGTLIFGFVLFVNGIMAENYTSHIQHITHHTVEYSALFYLLTSLSFFGVLLSFFLLLTCMAEDTGAFVASSRLYIIAVLAFIPLSFLSYYIKSEGAYPAWHDILTFWNFHMGKIAICFFVAYWLLFSIAWTLSMGGFSKIIRFALVVLMFPVLFIMSLFGKRC